MPQQEPMALEQSEKQTLFDASTTSNDHILMGSGMLHPTPWNQAKDSTMVSSSVPFFSFPADAFLIQLVQSRPIMPYQGEDRVSDYIRSIKRQLVTSYWFKFPLTLLLVVKCLTPSTIFIY